MRFSILIPFFILIFSCKKEQEIFNCSPIPCAGQEIDDDEIRFVFLNENREPINIESIIDKNQPFTTNDSVSLINPSSGTELNIAIFPANGNDITEPQLRVFLNQWDISVPYVLLNTPFGNERRISFNITKTLNECKCYLFKWDKRIIVNEDTLSPIQGGILTYELTY